MRLMSEATPRPADWTAAILSAPPKVDHSNGGIVLADQNNGVRIASRERLPIVGLYFARRLAGIVIFDLSSDDRFFRS